MSPDTVDEATRSRMMAGIRGRDTRPEVAVRRHLHSRGLRFRLHVAALPGRPDIVLPRCRTVVLVHGCFWHGHPGCRFAYRPKSNVAFWEAKLDANIRRDERDRQRLAEAGWRVLIVWECEINGSRLDALVDQLRDKPEMTRTV